MQQLGDIVDAGIDYLSMTMPNDNPHIISWRSGATAYLHEIAATGIEITESRRLGYYGQSVGGSFVGERERDTIAVYSGERAKAAFPRLYRPDVHVSRLDVQVSFRYDVSTANVAEIARAQVKQSNRTISSARHRNATLIEDLRGGATCYIGTRKSEQFARIYNKDAESGDKRYENVWRYEVQLKNKYASKLAEQFTSNTYSPPMHATVFVKQWLKHRGVSTPWMAMAELLPLPTITKQPTQLEEKLMWLQTIVRPSIRVLLKYGLRDAILEALGLDDLD
jgi:hypothetical protein